MSLQLACYCWPSQPTTVADRSGSCGGAAEVAPVCNYFEVLVLPWGFSTWGVHPQPSLSQISIAPPADFMSSILEPGLSEDIF